MVIAALSVGGGWRSVTKSMLCITLAHGSHPISVNTTKSTACLDESGLAWEPNITSPWTRGVPQHLATVHFKLTNQFNPKKKKKWKKNLAGNICLTSSARQGYLELYVTSFLTTSALSRPPCNFLLFLPSSFSSSHLFPADGLCVSGVLVVFNRSCVYSIWSLGNIVVSTARSSLYPVVINEISFIVPISLHLSLKVWD